METKNEDSERILDSCEAMEIKIMKSWFWERGNKGVTYESGKGRSMIDFILARKWEEITAVHIEVFVGMQNKLLSASSWWKSRRNMVKGRRYTDQNFGCGI